MTLIYALLLSLFAAFLAVVAKRIARWYCRRLREDCDRVQAASELLAEQSELLDVIVRRDTIPVDLKRFLVDLAEMTTNHNVARLLTDYLVDGHEDDETDERGLTIGRMLSDLAENDRKGFEIVARYVRTSMVAAVMQWEDTSKRIARLTSRVVSEPTAEIASTAADAMRRSLNVRPAFA